MMHGALRSLALVVFWTVAVGAGITRLLEYENTPARPSVVPANWPRASALSRRPGHPTLLVLAHPHCPCTRATVGELEIVAAQTQGLLDIVVLFLDSDAFDYRSGLWRQVKAIPGATAIADREGKETRRFGAVASGHVLLYDGQDRLAFSGGITGSRGHAGANVGRDAVIAQVRQGRAEASQTPVFGCALQDPDGAARR